MQDSEKAGAPCLDAPAARPALTRTKNTSSIPQTGTDGQGPNRETRRREVRDGRRGDDGGALAVTTLTPARPRAAVLVSVYTETGVRRRVVLSLPAAERARDRALEAGHPCSLDLVVLAPASGEAERGSALAEVQGVSA